MAKPLSELSFADLGRLFPVILTEYDPVWPVVYAGEKKLIERTVGKDTIIRISHIGSTAIPGTMAKPTIDILLEVREGFDKDDLIRAFIKRGYLYDPQPEKPPPHIFFMKGYTPEGFAGQAFHVHVRYSGDWDYLWFRDYLIGHPEVAKQYVGLKRRLLEEFEFDREAYTEGKSGFVRSVVQKARGYPGR